MENRSIQPLCTGDLHLDRYPIQIPDKLDRTECSPRFVWQETVRENEYLVTREQPDNDEILIRMIERVVAGDVPRDNAAKGVDDLLARITEDRQDD